MRYTAGQDRPRLRQFYADLYELHRAFGGMKPTEANWADLYEAARDLAEQNGESDFVCRLIAVTLEQIEIESAKSAERTDKQ